MSTPHVWTELAASYVLDALDKPDRVAFEAHLAECEECRADVAGYSQVTALLAHAAEPRTPPPALKQRILRAAQQVSPNRTAASARAAEPARLAPRQPGWPLAAAAGLLLAFGTLFLYTQERSTSEALRRERTVLRDSMAALAGEMAKRDSLIAAVLGADTRTITLAARGRPPAARMYWNRAHGTVVIAAFDLPPAPRGRTYQAWGIAGGAPVSLGTFNTNADGHAVVTLPVPGAVDFQVGAVTEEPSGGSPQPTSQPFLVGTL
jgi:anti-sigma-K factor RskA